MATKKNTDVRKVPYKINVFLKTLRLRQEYCVEKKTLGNGTGNSTKRNRRE